MKSSRESVHRREDWREREGEDDGRAHKLLNLIHCTSCWNMSPSNMKPHSGCVVSFLLFLFSSSLLFLESYFPSSFNFYQFYGLSLLQELFHKHLSAVELALSPWGSRIVFFSFSVQIIVCLLHSFTFPPVAVVFLESKGKMKKGKG